VRVFVALPVTVDGQTLGVVVLSRTPLDMGKALFQIRWQLLTAASVLILVVLLIALFTSLTISRPVQALIRQAERVVRGEKGAAIPLERPVTEEIDQLSQALAGMAHSLEERADYIRTFATNVSHEFKTPLTSIRGTVELLQEHLLEMTTAERSRFLQIIASDTDRLDRLVRRLLDLARADVLTPGAERAPVNEILDRLSRSFAEKGVAVTVEQALPVLTVRMAPETFESIVANLIDNARQHGGDKVRVQLVSRSIGTVAGTLVELEVMDNGPGISVGNRERIFRPFFTTARDRGGSGLGLAIVQALVSAHGGTIDLASSKVGARFVIRLPAGSA
jgi:signal transduction histidine kinase